MSSCMCFRCFNDFTDIGVDCLRVSILIGTHTGILRCDCASIASGAAMCVIGCMFPQWIYEFMNTFSASRNYCHQPHSIQDYCDGRTGTRRLGQQMGWSWQGWPVLGWS